MEKALHWLHFGWCYVPHRQYEMVLPCAMVSRPVQQVASQDEEELAVEFRVFMNPPDFAVFKRSLPKENGTT